jgi:hypothetical protein
LLFISEAPPTSGGFWRTGEYDDLRKNLFELLKDHGLQIPLDINSKAAFEVFLSGDFFLVQALKWPLARGKRKKRPSFNHLGLDQQRRLIEG